MPTAPIAPPLLTLDQLCRVPNIFPAGSDMAKLHEFACRRASMEPDPKDEVCSLPNAFGPGTLGDNLYNALCNPTTSTPLPNLCELASQAPDGSSEATMYTLLCQTPSNAPTAAEIRQICNKPMDLSQGTPEHATHFYACRQ